MKRLTAILLVVVLGQAVIIEMKTVQNSMAVAQTHKAIEVMNTAVKNMNDAGVVASNSQALTARMERALRMVVPLWTNDEAILNLLAVTPASNHWEILKQVR